MCRFIAYHGKKPLALHALIVDPVNSLVKQSKACRDGVARGKSGLNADGVGVAWYNRRLCSAPGVFRSSQPAWNDHNLESIAAVTASTCFIGHIRAATVGDVNVYNSHPFQYRNYSFVHNGTIKHFGVIRKGLVSYLSDEYFNIIHGQTDSEHFFALIMQLLHEKKRKRVTVRHMAEAVVEAVRVVLQLQSEHKHSCLSRINIVLTDGVNMLVMRYISDPDERPVSLHYCLALSKTTETHKKGDGIVIASEPLTDYEKVWHELPLNSLLLIHGDGEHEVVSLPEDVVL